MSYFSLPHSAILPSVSLQLNRAYSIPESALAPLPVRCWTLTLYMVRDIQRHLLWQAGAGCGIRVPLVQVDEDVLGRSLGPEDRTCRHAPQPTQVEPPASAPPGRARSHRRRQSGRTAAAGRKVPGLGRVTARQSNMSCSTWAILVSDGGRTESHSPSFMPIDR